MDLIELYPAAVNSKVTVTLGVMNADSTIVEVLDGSVLPEAPNLLVLGTDQTAETVRMTAKEGNKLTIERAVQGDAIAWPAGTQVARNFTAKDWNDMIANIATIVAKVMGLSAADVHARPDTWMPTASDVGALPIAGNGTLANNTDVSTMMNNNGWWLLPLGNTYYGLPPALNGKALVGWCIFEIQGQSARLKMLGTSYMYECVDITTGAWKQLFLADGSVPMSGVELKLDNGNAWLFGIGNSYVGINVKNSDNTVSGLTAYADAISYFLRGKEYCLFGEHNKELLSGAETDIALIDSLEVHYEHGCSCWVDADNTVHLRINAVVKNNGSLTANGDMTIGTIPVGFRPRRRINGVINLQSSSGMNMAMLWVNEFGTVALGTSNNTAFSFLHGELTYKLGN